MTLSDLPREFGGAAGGVTGREHRRAERDGQDGCALVAEERVVAAIVTDGCSSGRASEIGARVGAAWLAALVAQRFGGGHVVSEATARTAAHATTEALLRRLALLARSLSPDGGIDAARVDQALLFAFLAAVITPTTTIVFGIGDGIVVVDDHVTVLDPGPANAPPYVAYGLLGESIAPCIHFVGPTEHRRLLAVATDGLAPLTLPRRDEAPTLVGLASDPRYALNPSLLRKRLVVLSDRGLFSDDATVAVLQRRST